MNKIIHITQQFLIALVAAIMFVPTSALALSNESGSDPSGKSQRYVIENAPWYDPTACPNGVVAVSPTGKAQTGKTYIIGDSIAGEDEISQKLSDALIGLDLGPVVISAEKSRSLSSSADNKDGLAGITQLKSDQSKWQDAKNIIIELGTNGGISNENIKTTVDAIKATNPGASIFWVNVGADNSKRSTPIDTVAINNILQNNANLGYQIIDWRSKVESNKEYIINDGVGVHPYTDAGRQAFVDTLIKSISIGNGTNISNIESSCSCPAGITNTGFNGSTNVEIAFNFLNGKLGLNAIQTAGIVGNLMWESGGSSGNIDPAALNEIGAFGIAQWLGGRKDNLIKFARDKGKEATDLGVQLDFIIEELNKTEGTALNAVLNSKTVKDATISWEENYERSGGSKIDQRINNANLAYIKYGANAVGNYTIPGSINCSNNVGSIAQAPNGFAFPLITTKTQIKKGNQAGLFWCYDANVSCHHSYPGADIAVPEGTVVVASEGGRVINVNPECAKDCSITIKGNDNNVYYYDHMSSGSIKHTKGDIVKTGDNLGQVGTAADAEDTSPHLHLSIMNSKWDYHPACGRDKVVNGKVIDGCPNRGDMIDPQPWLKAAYNYLAE